MYFLTSVSLYKHPLFIYYKIDCIIAGSMKNYTNFILTLIIRSMNDIYTMIPYVVHTTNNQGQNSFCIILHTASNYTVDVTLDEEGVFILTHRCQEAHRFSICYTMIPYVVHTTNNQGQNSFCIILHTASNYTVNFTLDEEGVFI